MTDMTTSTEPTGSGELINPGAQAVLEKNLAKTQAKIDGMEDLSEAALVSLRATLEGATGETQSMLTSVLEYMRATGVHANLQPGVGARLHTVLYRNLQNYVNNAPADFRKGFGALLRIVADQKKSGVFSPRYIFRFVKEMTLAHKDRQGLEAFFETLVALSEANGRAQSLKQVDLAKVSSMCLNANGAQRLIGFFAT